MTLDPQTLLFAMLLVIALVGGACLPIWVQDREQTSILWLASAAALFCIGMVSRVALPFVPAIALSNSLVLVSNGFIWTACRSLRKELPRPVVLGLPVLLWLCLCLIPGFRANVDLRIGLLGILALGQLGLGMREIWLLELGTTIIRLWVLTLLGIQAIVTLARSIPALLWPHVTYVPFAAIPGIVLTMVDAVAFTLLFGVGLITLNKELSDHRHRDAAQNDFVTGVGNRRYFDEVLRRHFRRARKYAQPLAVIMIDADDFKAYNDLYGHPAGDRCLQALAQVFVNACRPSDIVGRYGGEEFAVLLPDTNAQVALSVAQRMLVQVRALSLKHAGSPGGIVTVSLGVASMVPHSDEMVPHDLVEAADRALYKAKQEGRNRICWTFDECALPAVFQIMAE
jgi:diguanylate cyclase (GGDEF)-like protein